MAATGTSPWGSALASGGVYTMATPGCSTARTDQAGAGPSTPATATATPSRAFPSGRRMKTPRLEKKSRESSRLAPKSRRSTSVMATRAATTTDWDTGSEEWAEFLVTMASDRSRTMRCIARTFRVLWRPSAGASDMEEDGGDMADGVDTVGGADMAMGMVGSGGRLVTPSRTPASPP